MVIKSIWITPSGLHLNQIRTGKETSDLISQSPEMLKKYSKDLFLFN